MKIRRLTLKGFKRFDDLTIELGDSPARIVALVGPIGCGKSSIFDAFEEKAKDYKSASGNESHDFFQNSLSALFMRNSVSVSSGSESAANPSQ